MYNRVSDKRRIDDITEDEEAVGTLCRLSTGSGRLSPKQAMEHEKRIRREIANSNERRRMQSINAGFNALKNLLPHQDGEKLSKASILQQTADYVVKLQRENMKLSNQLTYFRTELKANRGSDGEASASEVDSVSEETTILTSTPTRTMMVDLKEEAKSLECRVGLDLKRKIKVDHFNQATDDHTKRAWLTRPSKILRTSLHVQQRGIDVKDEQLTPAQTPEHTVEFKVDPLGLEIREKSIQKSPIYVNSPNNVTYETTPNSTSTPSSIVTVLSSKEHDRNTKGTILEVTREDRSPAVSNGSAEYMDEEQMVYIVNGGNNSQKSLATICEAIRHLEGDHMFPPEDQHSRLEEEVVAEETYGAEEDLHQSVPQDHPTPQEVSSYDARYHQPAAVATRYPRPEHPIGGSMSNLTLQMIAPEPQEVPLELTTNRLRPAQEIQVSAGPGSPLPTRSIPQVVIPRQSVNTLSSSQGRPGVIVVKHT